jgi:CRP/FNR family transcriptional regulator, cyclic AMP receptor protein
MRPTRIELLQAMPVFGGIRDDALLRLLDAARERAVAAGACFFRERDAADSMFVLESGRVAVVRTRHGHDYVLQRLGAGDCFGEMALMDLAPRSATVQAEEDCLAIEIGMGDLLHLYEHDPAQFALIQMNIGREVCRRLRAVDDLLFLEGIDASPVAAEILFRAVPPR